jgi:hypothetical protein
MTDDPGSLDKLRDLALPEPVALWPPAAGIVIVAAALLAVLAILGWRALARYRASAYRRAALAALDATSPDDPAAVEAISAVLKRTALAAFPRASVAALTGAAWAEFLAATAPGAVDGGLLRQSLGLAFGRSAATSAEVERLVAEARAWVAHHAPADLPERG